VESCSPLTAGSPVNSSRSRREVGGSSPLLRKRDEDRPRRASLRFFLNDLGSPHRGPGKGSTPALSRSAPSLGGPPLPSAYCSPPSSLSRLQGCSTPRNLDYRDRPLVKTPTARAGYSWWLPSPNQIGRDKTLSSAPMTAFLCFDSKAAERVPSSSLRMVYVGGRVVPQQMLLSCEDEQTCWRLLAPAISFISGMRRCQRSSPRCEAGLTGDRQPSSGGQMSLGELRCSRGSVHSCFDE